MLNVRSTAFGGYVRPLNTADRPAQQTINKARPALPDRRVSATTAGQHRSHSVVQRRPRARYEGWLPPFAAARAGRHFRVESGVLAGIRGRAGESLLQPQPAVDVT